MHSQQEISISIDIELGKNFSIFIKTWKLKITCGSFVIGASKVWVRANKGAIFFANLEISNFLRKFQVIKPRLTNFVTLQRSTGDELLEPASGENAQQFGTQIAFCKA